MANRGGQSIPIRVESIRPIRVLNAPLLMDPGPPRIVLAYRDATTDGIVFPTLSGDSGLSPEALGVTVADYAGAVCGTGDVRGVMEQMFRGAAKHVRKTESWKTRRLRVCRQSWIPDGWNTDSVEFLPWWKTVTPLPSASYELLVRIGAWTTEAMARSDPNAQAATLDLQSLPSIGQWLASRLQTRPRRVLNRPDPWLILAAEALLADYSRGPNVAWKRFLHAWKSNVPEASNLPFDWSEADTSLQAYISRHVNATLEQIGSFAVGSGNRLTIRFFSSLFLSQRLPALIESVPRPSNIDILFCDTPWIDRLAT